MSFKTYLSASEKTYKYRLKTVAPLTSESVAAISSFMQRYHLISVSGITKTMFQNQPLDFESVRNAEVYIVDIELRLPVSSYVIQRELVGVLGLPGDYLVVRGENDPMEVQTDAINQNQEVEAQAAEDGLEAAPLLGVESEYPEAEQTADGKNYYGDVYNNRLLAYIQDVRDAAEKQENTPVEVQVEPEVIAPVQVDPPSPLFKWIEMPKPTEPDNQAFNADMPKVEDVPADQNLKHVSKYGNFDDENTTIKKTFVDKNSVLKTLSATPTSLNGVSK